MAGTRKSSGRSAAVAAAARGARSAAVAGGVDVFGYLDYRAYLRDVYVAKKAEGRGFSYRAFSQRAGLKSPNFLKLVIDGQRNLTRAMGEKFASALGLSDEATAHFLDLVGFGQAKNIGERTSYYQRLSSSARYQRTHQLELAQASYHSSWYIPAIRELAACAEFSSDPAWIAARLRPRIARADAAHALDVLISLGLLVRDRDGRVHQGTSALVSTGAEARGVHIASYHKAMMARAVAAIDELPSAQRDVSSLTLCVGPSGLANLKERLGRFRRELLELSTLEDDPQQVIQLNFQLFPLSAAEDEA
jgi:uncharacterized protein (TIGR02147 family)